MAMSDVQDLCYVKDILLCPLPPSMLNKGDGVNLVARASVVESAQKMPLTHWGQGHILVEAAGIEPHICPLFNKAFPKQKLH